MRNEVINKLFQLPSTLSSFLAQFSRQPCNHVISASSPAPKQSLVRDSIELDSVPENRIFLSIDIVRLISTFSWTQEGQISRLQKISSLTVRFHAVRVALVIARFNIFLIAFICAVSATWNHQKGFSVHVICTLMRDHWKIAPWCKETNSFMSNKAPWLHCYINDTNLAKQGHNLGLYFI